MDPVLIVCVLTLYLGGTYPPNVIPVQNYNFRGATAAEATDKCATAKKFWMDNRDTNGIVDANCGPPITFPRRP